MPGLQDFNLDIDLVQGMVPISKAASSLAALIKRSRQQQQPVVVTQKGYPVAVILPIELYAALSDVVNRASASTSDDE